MNAVPMPPVMAGPIAMALVLAIVLGTMVVYLVLSFLFGAAPVVCIIVTAVISAQVYSGLLYTHISSVTACMAGARLTCFLLA